MNHRVAVRSFAVAAVLGAMGCASSGGPPPSVGAAQYARTGYVTTEATASTYRAPASTSAPGAYGGDVVQSAPPAEAPPSASPPPPPMPSSPGSAVSGGASVAPRYDGAAAESSDDAPRRSSALPSPQERPGLATQWGENRESAVRFTSFERATTAPFEVASIHYNDAGWAAIQARYHGGGGPRGWFGAYRDGIRISLRDEMGNPLPGYPAGDRMYVLGQAGRRYVILLENATPYRFEAVVSVDGLDVINGRAASLGFRGYILPPRGSVQIDGWRRSESTVAAFRFGSVGESYAAERGDARNVGVVGVALYAEAGVVMQPWDMQRELDTREQANPFPGPFAPPPRRPNY